MLVAVPLMLLVFMAQPDNFSLYQPLVAGALWLGARGLRGHARSFALAGLLVGLATLSRNDGLLVGATLGLAFLWDRWRAWRSGGARLPAIPAWAAVACAGLFAIVMAPWIVRQLEVFGSLSPSTASGKVLFIRSIEEWNSITTPANLSWLLDQGLGPLVTRRIGGLVAAVGIFSTLACAVVLVVPLVIGAWSRRRSVWFGPFFAYAGILFAFSAIVSAVHVPGGTFIHSAVALVPHTFILILEGIAVAVGWIAARRRAWNREQATRVFITATVGAGAVLAVVVSLAVHGSWAQKRADRASLGEALAVVADPDARVMSIDASGIKYATGHGGVVSPNDPIETIHDVATAYRTEWLILERDSIVKALAPVLTGQRGPTWVGPADPATAADGGPRRGATRSARARPRALRDRSGRPRRARRRGRRPWPGTRVSRREAWLSALVVFARRARPCVRGRLGSSSRCPRTRRTTSASRATSSTGTASSPTRCGATGRRRCSSRATPSRSGCRCRRSPPSYRWRSSAPIRSRGDAGRQLRRRDSAALVPVLAWRLAADVAAERGLPVGPGPVPGGRHGPPTGRGLPAARPPLDPARFDDAVRRAGAGGDPPPSHPGREPTRGAARASDPGPGPLSASCSASRP